MTKEKFFSELSSNCLGEFLDSEKNETVLYLDFNEDEKCIEVGTMCNVGLIVDFTVDYDSDFTIDENLQNVMDELYNNGFSNIE